MGSKQRRLHFKSESRERSLCSLPRHFLALLASFRQANGDGLFAVFLFPGSPAPAAARAAAFVAVHLAPDLVAGAAGISALSSFGHPLSSKGCWSRNKLRTTCDNGCICNR